MQNLSPFFAVGDIIFIIPIVATIMGLAIPLLAIFGELSRKRRIYELYHQQRMAAIEKGIDLPPWPSDLVNDAPRGRPRYLLRGLLWLFVGIGVLISLSAVTRPEADKAWTLAFIPIGVGLAYLIYHMVEGKRLDASPKGERGESKIERVP
jgi:hypothetical protein